MTTGPRHPDSCDCRSTVGQWYRAHSATIRQFILARTGDHHIADDCTSETFVRAIRHLHTFRCQGSGVRPWLVTIARNGSRDLTRKPSSRLEAVDALESSRTLTARSPIVLNDPD